VRIHAIQTGTVTLRPRQLAGAAGPLRVLKTLADSEWLDPLPILAWLIEHPEGLIVVDTGETARASEPGYFPAWHPYHRRCVRMSVQPDDEIGPQLRARGFDPRDVRWVVLTHLHTDHAGGLAHFPDSEIVVTQAEFEYAKGRRGRLRGYPNSRWPDWLDPTFAAAPHALTAAGDVRLEPTPGHTPGHIAVTVDTGDAFVILAGDASYTQQLMLDDRVDGVTSDPKAYRATLARLRAIVAERSATYLPAHEAESVQRLEAAQTGG
jgi:glyoxylase-like metal-dependent hydrolase (beta-lactamase superfamily II)